MHIRYWWESQKRPLARSRRRWVDNIKIDLRKIGWNGMDWIDLAQNGDQWRALVNTVINLRVKYNVGKFSSSCTTGGFSRRAQLHQVITYICRSRRWRGLRHEPSSPTRTLGSWVRISLEARMSVCSVCLCCPACR
jgi:hypothetical protein